MRYFLILCFSLSFFAQAQTGEGRYTFVFLNTNTERPQLPQKEVDSLQAGHMANIGRLIKERKMIAAGPYYTGGGIFIFDTNLEETQAVLDSDPAIAAGRFKLEVYPFDMLEGEICTLWDKEESEVQMTTYQFARFQPDSDFSNLSRERTNRLTQKHLAKMANEVEGFEVLGILSFTGNQGQVAIYKANDEDGHEDLLANHLFVKQGMMTLEHKKLYFAQGVFCEN